MTSTRRQGLLRQDHLPAAGRRSRCARTPTGRSRWSRRPTPHTVVFRLKCPEASLPAEPGLAVELDLQGGHPGQGHPLVREERHGHRALHVRRARAGLALGRARGTPTTGTRASRTSTATAPSSSAVLGSQVAAIRGERAHIQFRGFSPAERDALVRRSATRSRCRRAPGTADPWCAMNHEKKPFDDKRVRRALTLALDRYEGSKALSQIAVVKDVARHPGARHAVGDARPTSSRSSPATAGTSTRRAPRRRSCCKEAGARGLLVHLQEPRRSRMPYEPIGIWLDRPVAADRPQRQAGEIIEASAYHPHAQARRLRGRHGLPVRLHRRARPGPARASSTDVRRQLRQAQGHGDRRSLSRSRRAPPTPRSARSSCARFEKRLLDEEAHYIMTLQWHRIIPHSAKVQGLDDHARATT